MSTSGRPTGNVGNYANVQRRVDRRPAHLVSYQGGRAHIRFHDGTTYAIPSEPLKKLGLTDGAPFFVVTTWSGKTPIETRVELPAAARGPAEARPMPKTYVRDGKKVVTRR